MAFNLARSGYFGGDPEKVLAARVDLVLAAHEYEQFRSEYESVEYELNKS